MELQRSARLVLIMPNTALTKHLAFAEFKRALARKLIERSTICGTTTPNIHDKYLFLL